MKNFLMFLVACVACAAPVGDAADVTNVDIAMQTEICTQVMQLQNVDDCGVIVCAENCLVAIKCVNVFSRNQQMQVVEQVKQTVLALVPNANVQVVLGVKELHVVKNLQRKLEEGKITIEDLKKKLLRTELFTAE